MLHIRSIRRGLLAALLLAAVPAALTAAAGPASAAPAPPPAGTCEPVEVTRVKLTQNNGVPVIVVLGVTSHADTRIQLDPEDIDFAQQPDYFPYFVNGCGGTGPSIEQPFQAVFSVPTAPVGRLGITINQFTVDLFAPDGPPEPE